MERKKTTKSNNGQLHITKWLINIKVNCHTKLVLHIDACICRRNVICINISYNTEIIKNNDSICVSPEHKLLFDSHGSPTIPFLCGFRGANASARQLVSKLLWAISYIIYMYTFGLSSETFGLSGSSLSHLPTTRYILCSYIFLFFLVLAIYT